MLSLWSRGIGSDCEAGNPIREDGESPALMRGELSTICEFNIPEFSGGIKEGTVLTKRTVLSERTTLSKGTILNPGRDHSLKGKRESFSPILTKEESREEQGSSKDDAK